MGELPTGTITMLFSDIEGSTVLLTGLGDRYGEALSAQRALLRAAFSACGGREMGTEGDSFFVVFASAQDAVRSCVAAQRALSAHDWPDGVAVRVRMGLHSGEPTRHEDGYIGLDVHRAARIAATAHGGQVVLSEATRLLLGSRLPADVSLRDLGLHRLKDIEAPEHIYQLAAPGLPERFPPLKSLGPPAPTVGMTTGVHGFVAVLTSFVGRSVELDKVADLLDRYRMVTVTGPGGMGKTRLAGEVARRVADRFADGVWQAELAGVADPGLVPAAVATALGLQHSGGGPVMVALADVLAARQVLLVLDNCEHLIDAVAGLCGTLLPAADDVRILATSREPAGVPGEARYRLPPLSLPEPGPGGGANGSAAVALFADRARQADPQFTMNGETGSAVARLVSRLDGMPLAIELAAARVEVLGVGQLLDRLDDQFSLLAGANRLAPARHRSLAATVEWSYQLLSEDERRVFRRVSVFPGPFTLEAAEMVAGAGAGPAVLHLADCSLIVPPHTGPDGRPRYLMLETLRAYGTGRLAEAGELPDAAAALTRHALQVAGQAAAGLETRDGELAAGRWLDAEDATVHQALGWALEHDPDAALRLAIALAPWWLLRGRWATGYQLLADAAGRGGEDRPEWCTAQLWLGLLTAASNVTTSFSHLTLVRDAFAGRPPAPVLARALAWRAGALANLGRVPEAAGEGRRALALARELGDPVGEAFALYWLATAAAYVGNFQDAEAWMRQAQRIDQAAISGWIARHCTIALARVLGEMGEATEAQRCSADALALARQAGALYDEGECLLTMALLDLYAGRLPETRAHVREVLELFAQTSASLLLINCLELCVRLSAAARHWRELITLWAAFTAVRRATWIHGEAQADDPAGEEEFQEPLHQAREALGPTLARAAEERGAAMTPAAAAEYILLLVTEEPDEPAAAPDLPQLNARERELVILVARGRTDAQIAAQLSVSVRTVRSRLDRIRAKTGSRRRADLTRLALQADLVLAGPHRPCQTGSRRPGRSDRRIGERPAAGDGARWHCPGRVPGVILLGRRERAPAGLQEGRACGYDAARRRGRSAAEPGRASRRSTAGGPRPRTAWPAGGRR
jgi:predicted ATPase/class 3 adenylate cyclase/DNA-binding CsgD family transcriptional regulator